MKRLTTDIKRMLSALSHENAGEFLSHKNKLALLESCHIPAHTPVYSSVHAEQTRRRQPQVALIFDGHASQAVTDYLLTTPHIFNTEICILAHGNAPDLEQKTQALAEHLEEAGRNYTITYLLEDMSDAFQEFCNDNPDLQFLIAPKSDLLAREIIENPEFHSHSHKVPLMMIQDSELETKDQSAE